MAEKMSGREKKATLMSGRTITYIETDNPPRGGMKHTYFTPDRKFVVQFFNDPEDAADPNMRKRLESIIGKYNPTLAESEGGAAGGTIQTASYFADLFCWPIDLVKDPAFGVVCPAYPGNFFFGKGASTSLPLKGKDKKSKWFTSKNRKWLEKAELGDFQQMLGISLLLARSMRRLHQAGLAHSDLSSNNVLIDPQTGRGIVIDIDSLVVPGLYPPEVAGTREYIAPEVLETMDLPLDDPHRKLPSIYTDLHALSVLIYQYLLNRHPLEGPKVYSTESAEEDDYLAMGPKATFIEDPKDTSNRRDDMHVTIHDMGSKLEQLFVRALSDGLHDLTKRPSAMEWETGLLAAWDMLVPCPNPKCTGSWFVLPAHGPAHCPFCGQKVGPEQYVRFDMKVRRRGSNGQWMSAGTMSAYHGKRLWPWDTIAHSFADEKANHVDPPLMADIVYAKGRWFFRNDALPDMRSSDGSHVPKGQYIELHDQMKFQLSGGEDGLLVEVRIGN